MAHRRTIAAIIRLAGVALLPFGAHANDWPAWRGPDGNGAAEGTAPIEWGPDRGILWSTPLPAWAGSSPIVVGDHVLVVSPSGTTRDGRPAERAGNRLSPGGDALVLICLDRHTGRARWTAPLGEGNTLHRKSNDAAPSPVSDGTHVWVVTGRGAIVALDMTGAERWRKDLTALTGPLRQDFGYASSPVLHDGRLILAVLHDGPGGGMVIALDAATGEVAWRQDRWTDAPREAPDAYTTPILVPVDGTTRLVVSGADYVTAHDLDSGRELWRTPGLNPNGRPDYRVVASPVAAAGLVITPSRVRPVLAVRPDGGADVTDRIAWTWDARSGPDVPTPTTDGRLVYFVDDQGIATCLDAATGETVWGPERTARGTVSASPILVGGRIYIVNESAQTTVIDAGRSFRIVTTNDLDGSYTLSSPAAAGGRLYLRTGEALYCLGAPDPAEPATPAEPAGPVMPLSPAR